MKRYYRADDRGVMLHLRVTPNAGMDRIEGPEVRDDGQEVLRVRVRAVPDRGKANTAVIALLARALGVPRGAIAVTAGETSRSKTLRLTGDPAALLDALQRLAEPAVTRLPRAP